MKKELECYEVWSDQLLRGDFSALNFLPKIGLNFNEKAKKAVDPTLSKIS